MVGVRCRYVEREKEGIACLCATTIRISNGAERYSIRVLGTVDALASLLAHPYCYFVKYLVVRVGD